MALAAYGMMVRLHLDPVGMLAGVSSLVCCGVEVSPAPTSFVVQMFRDCEMEAFSVRTSRLLLSVMFGFLVLGLASPVYAQEAAARAAGSGLVQWSIITAGFALAIAAAGAALGQGKAVASAAEAIARNPGAAGEIRGALILGLVLIESLVIYVLLVSLILFFIKPFGG